MSTRTILLLFATSVVLLLLSAAQASAADVHLVDTAIAAVAAPDLYGLLVDFGERGLHWALTILAGAAAWLLVRAGLSARWRSLLEELGAHARDIVQEVFQVYVETLKAARADGKLTDAEKAHARDQAVAKLRSRLGWRKLLALGGGLLGRILGASGWAAKVDELLGGAVETAVAEAKREGKAAGLVSSGKDLKKPEPPPLPPL